MFSDLDKGEKDRTTRIDNLHDPDWIAQFYKTVDFYQHLLPNPNNQHGVNYYNLYTHPNYGKYDFHT